MATTSLHIPKETGMRLVIGAVLLLVFAAATILPVLTEIKKADTDIAEAKVEIERQKLLHPAHEEILEVVRTPLPEGLPMPEPATLSEADIAGVESLLDQAAQAAGFTTREIAPDPSSLADDSRFLLVNASFQGEVAGLRTFMIQLGAIPVLTHIEQMRIEESLGSILFDFRLWLALEKQ